jgi:hypothetical protein
VSEELENSLQQAIETYVNDRLRSIDEQLSRLQNEMSEGLARLREQSANLSLDGTPVSAAIFAHLQTARGEHLSAQAAAPVPPDAAKLKQATQEIEAQQSQTDVLKALLRGAVNFADRVALFVIKNEQAIGWRIARATDPDLEMIGGVSLPLTAESVVTRAARERAVASGAADSDSAMLMDHLGGSPGLVVALPLVVRGKVVAVLYGDSASSDANTLNADALEVLARVASMAVNIVSIQRAMPGHPHAAHAEAPAPAAQPERPVAEPTYVPRVEVVAPADERPVQQFTAPVEAAEEHTAPQITHEVEPEAPAAEITYEEPAPAFAAQPVEAPSAYKPEFRAPTEPLSAEPTPAGAAFSPEPAPAFASPYSAPLGATRRQTVTEPELPIDVSEDERRLHNDARRFARLLVSEIKLYNEPKVQEGRNKGDLYDRLRDDIDRSRQMYDKRVAPPVAARHDYFHQELVNTLAEGDPAKLGMSYPGAAISPN